MELSAVVANGYIVALNCINWVKSRKLTSYDKIITSLVFSRFCLQVFVSSDNFLYKLYPDFFHMNETSSPCAVIEMFINHCLSRNATISDNNKNHAVFAFLIHGIGSISPIILFITSSALLIISLWRHIRKMRLNSDLNASFRNPTMDAHVHALKSVVSFFILYNIYYMALTLSIGTLAYVSDEWIITVCTIIVAAYPSLHPIVLILGNPKLKLASARILHSANC
ncbi:taste receptor type 2 member 7-like [Gopherus evgoodei]|uniref:taste receptor type 2 member 7-like n=1 Tax=Gopherus evgoodei TaxID=1825980 RepID=UPI0011CF0BBB|nr:taste receptor type 2 member 7-like [Gopherus evgoodei]